MDEPNRLIREFFNPKRVPTEGEIKRVLDHVAKAPFASRMAEVQKEIRGRVFLGRRLSDKEPSVIAHLAKRVLWEEQWAEGTTPKQYLADLRTVIGDPNLKPVVFMGRYGTVSLGLLAPNRLPPERLGQNSEGLLWVVYSADYGTITTGYQVSSTDRITLPKEARWL